MLIPDSASIAVSFVPLSCIVSDRSGPHGKFSSSTCCCRLAGIGREWWVCTEYGIVNKSGCELKLTWDDPRSPIFQLNSRPSIVLQKFRVAVSPVTAFRSGSVTTSWESCYPAISARAIATCSAIISAECGATTSRWVIHHSISPYPIELELRQLDPLSATKWNKLDYIGSVLVFTFTAQLHFFGIL